MSKYRSYGKTLRFAIALCLLLFYITGCSSGRKFSELPGFQEFFATVPPGSASVEEQQLLAHYQPDFYLAAGQTRPIDFYQDYIANGFLHYCDGKKIAEEVTQQLLNKYKSDPNICFDYSNRTRQQREVAPLYARVDYEELQGHRLTFLSYYLVFANSGILKGLPWYKSFSIAVAGSLDDWHQLDNYIMARVVLNSSNQPIALTVQQHNYLTTYLPGIQLPLTKWWKLDIAMRSNELYPHKKGPQRHRAVSFINPDSLAYLLGNGEATTLSGYDHTQGDEQLQTALVFLPREDAFYRFMGRLGDKRLLPGRSAPPGAEFNTLPQLKSFVLSMLTSYRRPGKDEEFQELFKEWYKGFDSQIQPHIVEKLTQRFRQDLQQNGLNL